MIRKKRFPFFQKGRQSIKNSFPNFSISKRQKFILSVLILSIGLFFLQNLLGRSGVFLTFALSFLAVLLLFISNYSDMMKNFSIHFFILPFFYSLAFGLFYFLIPTRFLTRMLMTSMYAIGLYSLFLSQNIFAVASMRTIALLSSARTVSFIITLVSYFFLSNVVFTLDLPAIPTSVIVFVYTFFLSAHSIWTYTLDTSFKPYLIWVTLLSFCLFQASIILWFWPSSPTIIALFLTGLFYTITGLTHAWFDKRLFKNILWEYAWVALVISAILFLFTSWNP